MKQLWGAAGGRCSYPKCAERLIAPALGEDERVVLGEHAHIIPHSDGGPRGGEEFLAMNRRHTYENLILLCERHHRIVDGQPRAHSADVLRRFKREHEARCASPFENLVGVSDVEVRDDAPVTERVHTTMFKVEKLPRLVFSARTAWSDEREFKEKYRAAKDRSPPPFILRRGRLYSFANLNDQDNPFSDYVQAGTVTSERSDALWGNADRFGEFQALLRRVLFKICGGKGLQFDYEHNRWFFPPADNNTDRTVEYTPLNNKKSTRRVAWQPTVRATGEKKNYWEHLAVSVEFERVASHTWIFSIRPERYFTRDGVTPLAPKTTGRRATSAVARLYNGDVLEEVNFWRAYLSGNTSKIVKKLGRDVLVIDTRMLEADVTWPGVPDDSRPFKNVDLADDPAHDDVLAADAGAETTSDGEDE